MKKSICFVSLESTALFYPELPYSERIGGSEIQQQVIAQSLVDLFEIHYIVEDLGQKQDEVKNGIHLHCAYAPEQGIRWVRYLYPRLYSTWKAMQKADADIYYQRVASSLTGIVALFCRIHNKKFIYAVANDNEIEESWKLFKFKFEKLAYEYGLRKADLITVQNEFQKKGLKKKKDLNSILVNNICPSELSTEQCTKGYVLSVGMINPKKQFEKIIEAATNFPETDFYIIGKGRGEYFNRIVAEAEEYNNITIFTNLCREETLRYYRNAYMLLHASKAEGFPNVFLEAWANGIPVVSFKLDPSNYIDTYRLGYVAENFSDLLQHIEFLLTHSQVREEIAKNAVEHIKSFHSREYITPIFERLIEDISAS